MLRELTFPPLTQPYDTALRAVVDYVLARYQPVGIIASGSIVRGNPGPSSDLDIYVIHHETFRQRVQKWFAGVPAEIFINNPAAVRSYFVDEASEGLPQTAHMLATGFVVFDQDSVVELLRHEATTWLEKRPDRSPAQLTWTRYMTADLYDNAKDLRHSDPAMAAMTLHEAVSQMVRFAYLAANHNLPRAKELIARLGTLSGDLKSAVEGYYAATDDDTRFELAAQIAALTLGVGGFFEWETEPKVYP